MNELVVFDPVKAELAEYKKQNASLDFDYEDPQGNKDARSHIYKLRQAKTKIADTSLRNMHIYHQEEDRAKLKQVSANWEKLTKKKNK